MLIVDTGPLVAAADSADPDHDECAGLLQQETGPLRTTALVVAEAAYLIGRRISAEAEARFFRSIANGDLIIDAMVVGAARCCCSDQGDLEHEQSAPRRGPDLRDRIEHDDGEHNACETGGHQRNRRNDGESHGELQRLDRPVVAAAALHRQYQHGDTACPDRSGGDVCEWGAPESGAGGYWSRWVCEQSRAYSFGVW